MQDRFRVTAILKKHSCVAFLPGDSEGSKTPSSCLSQVIENIGRSPEKETP